MKYWTRIEGTRATSKAYDMEIAPNFTGQTGNDHIAFKVGGRWHFIKPETEADAKELMRQAHVLWHNFKTDEDNRELKRLGRVI